MVDFAALRQGMNRAPAAAPAPPPPQQFAPPAFAPPAFTGPAQVFAPAQPQHMPGAPGGPSIFAGIRNATEMFERGIQHKPGDYFELVKLVKLQPKRNFGYGLVIETAILVALDQVNGVGGNGLGHREGEEPITNWIASYGEAADYFLPNVKAFIAGAFGLTKEQLEQLDADDCDAIVGPDQPMAGLVVETHSELRPGGAKSKNPGKMFCRIGYKRRVAFAELASRISPAVQARFFPGNALADAVAKEAGQPR